MGSSHRQVGPVWRRRRAPAAATLLVPLVLVACGDSNGPLSPTDARPAEFLDDPHHALVFLTDRDGSSGEGGRALLEVYRMTTDGVENLTHQPARYYGELHYSPAADRFVFRSVRSGCYGLWTMRRDGSDPVRVTESGTRCNLRPRWSPDGSMIAFTSSRDVHWGYEVFVMDADGSNPRNVTQNLGLEQLTSNLVHGWTPDGRVVFHHATGSVLRTYVVNPDGTGLEPLFEEGDVTPFWSPDGSMIAFAREREGGSDLYVVSAAGGEPQKLTDGSGEEDWFNPGRGGSAYWDPWSPDGTRLAFTGTRFGGAAEIYVMNTDGTGLVNLTDDPGGNVFHGWSPDGSRIAFSSGREGTRNVYVVNPDGTGLQRLTDTESNDEGAVWVPLR